ncbi:hypothetical protein SAMN05880573_1397 [Chryseobacterium sp. RU33C]|nr:hypothetical protein SAMN05880573_1397 [Chryseobacterium sp. RU33C]
MMFLFLIIFNFIHAQREHLKSGYQINILYLAHFLHFIFGHTIFTAI